MSSTARLPIEVSSEGATSAENQTVFSFSGRSIGDEPAPGQRRFVVVSAYGFDDNSTFFIESLKVGGDDAAELVGATNMVSGWRTRIGMYYLEVPTGTTATIQVTFNRETRVAGISAYAVYTDSVGFSHTTDTDTGDPIDFTMDVDAGGAIIGASGSRSGGEFVGPSTWTGLTEDVDLNILSSDYLSTASGTFDDAQDDLAVQSDASSSGADHIGVCVAFSPA